MMVQVRLEGLLLMTVERKILPTLPHEAIIQQIAQSSAELSRTQLEIRAACTNSHIIHSLCVLGYNGRYINVQGSVSEKMKSGYIYKKLYKCSFLSPTGENGSGSGTA